jgi:uncharacterized spore protein YtfJ
MGSCIVASKSLWLSAVLLVEFGFAGGGSEFSSNKTIAIAQLLALVNRAPTMGVGKRPTMYEIVPFHFLCV